MPTAPEHIIPDLRRLARPIAGLRPDPKNARHHSARNLAAIADSLRAFGQQRPLVLGPDGRTVVAGSGTLLAARQLGWKRLAAVRSGLDRTHAAAFGVADNRTAELASWNEELLGATLKRVTKASQKLAVGWTPAELQQLVAAAGTPGPGAAAMAAVAEDLDPPEKPESKPGQLYELGRHRVLCADAFQPADWPKGFRELLSTRRAACYLADPPYAIYGSSSGLSADVTDDKIVRPFFLEVCRLAVQSTRRAAHIYIFCDWRSWPSWWEMAKVTRLPAKNLLVWDKGGAGLGNNYANTYELVGLFGNVRKSKVMTATERQGLRPVLKPNILRFDRARGAEREHNAAKPVALLRELIENSTDPGDVVFDSFLGSGSTLIACEETGRVCYGLDNDPRWVDVTRRRYERHRAAQAEAVPA